MRANGWDVQSQSEIGSKPAISIVMPLYNKEREVERAVQSVLKQTFGDYELIVVNDGSTDKGPEVVMRINDPRIRLINQKNAGVSAARNRGIKEARAELIALLDADDEWHPDFLETIIRLREDYPTCAVFATNYIFRGDNNYFRQAIIRRLSNGFKEGILTNYFVVAAKSDPPLCASAVAINKTAVISIGGFPVGVTSGEDLLTWAKLALNYKIAYSAKPKVYNWEPRKLSDRPGRFPQTPDIVGQAFIQLLNDCNSFQVKDLRKYIALWHQMRASIFLRLGRRTEAIFEVKEIARYSKKNIKLYFCLAIALLPQKLRDLGLGITKYLKYYRITRIPPQDAINIRKYR